MCLFEEQEQEEEVVVWDVEEAKVVRERERENYFIYFLINLVVFICG